MLTLNPVSDRPFQLTSELPVNSASVLKVALNRFRATSAFIDIDRFSDLVHCPTEALLLLVLDQ